jgi:hypothetical protein
MLVLRAALMACVSVLSLGLMFAILFPTSGDDFAR